jgi:CheY-like chemotaxis protein
MDVSMPVMGGLEATEIIRSFEKQNGLKETPIIGLSAHEMIGDRETCVQSGMNERISSACLLSCSCRGALMAKPTLEPLSRVTLLDAIEQLVRPKD